MVYIYEENNEVKYVRDIKPQAEKIIVLEKMIPIPNKEGYKSILKANFNTNFVWYDLIETEEHKRKRKINNLKEKLSQTDYKFMKFAEGFISEEEYAPVKALRQEWRDRINELEGSN